MSHVRAPSPAGRPARPLARVIVAIMVLAPLVGLLWVPFYARKKPELFGLPFFYWYQLLWVFVTAALTLVAYVIVRRGDIDRAEVRQAQRDEGTRS